jgi:hypothetical protein
MIKVMLQSGDIPACGGQDVAGLSKFREDITPSI